MMQPDEEKVLGTTKAAKNLTISLFDRAVVTGRLAKHFGFSKADLKASTEMNQDVLYYPDLDDKGFYKLICAGHHDSKFVFDHLFKPKKFIGGALHEAWLAAQLQVPQRRIQDVMIAFKMGPSWLWVLYEPEESADEGLGGIFLKTSDGNFVAEPFDNFLNFNYPLPESE